MQIAGTCMTLYGTCDIETLPQFHKTCFDDFEKKKKKQKREEIR
jgi:hypothetical protein